MMALAQRLESRDVDRDVVVDEEDRRGRRAPRRRAMSASTRGIGKRWKLRPRISMIEQKLQSNVQPREVSTTSTWRPSIV